MENRPSLKEWQEVNPEKSINDYFNEFPPLKKSVANQNISPTIQLQQQELNYQQNLLYLQTKEKNLALSMVLTIVFGPFGLFYTSSTNALMMLLAPFIGAAFGIVLPVLCQKFGGNLCYLSFVYWGFYVTFIWFYWVICVILSITSVLKHNKNLKLQLLNHQMN